jgi:hypothetical protein
MVPVAAAQQPVTAAPSWLTARLHAVVDGFGASGADAPVDELVAVPVDAQAQRTVRPPVHRLARRPAAVLSKVQSCRRKLRQPPRLKVIRFHRHRHLQRKPERASFNVSRRLADDTTRFAALSGRTSLGRFGLFYGVQVGQPDSPGSLLPFLTMCAAPAVRAADTTINSSAPAIFSTQIVIGIFKLSHPDRQQSAPFVAGESSGEQPPGKPNGAG